MDNQKYNKYDTICYIINANLYSYGTRHNKTINLGHFNLKDKKHLFLLEMAKMTSQIYGFNIILEIPWYKKIWSKKIRKIKSKKEIAEAIYIDCFLDFSCQDFPDIKIEDIYDEYFERK